jgi:hypothetical protein
MMLHALRHRRLAAGVSVFLSILYSGGRGLAGQPVETESIAWRDDYAHALDEAKAGNRLVWIQFTGPWCPNCARMDHDSFAHPSVLVHSRDSYVPVKLRSDVHEQLALSFNLSGLPATIVITANREIVALHQGYLGPVELGAFLRDTLSRQRAKPANRSLASRKPSTPEQEPQADGAPQDEELLAVDGYCPVSLVRDRKLVRGDAAYTVQHDGKTYRCATLGFRNNFSAEPDRFAPGNGGSCPVAELDRQVDEPGDPRWGVLYKSRLFLCASGEDRRRFLQDPERYAMVDVAEQGFCIHCIRESGLLVRGDPHHQVTRAGTRYWFPDANHRAAFLAALR